MEPSLPPKHKTSSDVADNKSGAAGWFITNEESNEQRLLSNTCNE